MKIAVQKDGRITEDSMHLLKAIGLELESRTRALVSPCRNFPIDLLSVRDDDIPEYVQDGVSDFGIVGENIVAERRARVSIVERLGFGKCRLVICVPDAPPHAAGAGRGRGAAISSVAQLQGKRIATSYPQVLRRFLAARGVRAEVIEISGSVEIAPALDVADATCDIMSTGSTARVNGLAALHTVMESEAVLIANASSLRSRKKRKDIDHLLTRIRSSLNVRGKKYIMMNAPLSAVKTLQTLIPGMKSPTIVPLANPGMVAVHSVVGEDVFWEVMEQLKRAGATDIVVVPIEKFIA